MFVLGCQKQSPPQLISDEQFLTDERRALACENSNYIEETLQYHNVINIFICGKWDKQFPHMFESIKKVDSVDWDHLIYPISNIFFSTKDKRDRLLGKINTLKNESALDDLSDVIRSLNDKNFFSSIDKILSCDIYKDGIVGCNAQERERVKALLVLFKFSKTDFVALSKFFGDLSNVLSELSLNEKFKPLRDNKNFKFLRMTLLNSFIQDYFNDRANFNRFNSLFSTSNSSNDSLLGSFFVNDYKHTEFGEILDFHTEDDYKFIKQIKMFNNLMKKKFVCTDSDDEVLLKKDFITETKEVLETIETGTQSEYFSKMSEVLGLIKVMKILCPGFDKLRLKYIDFPLASGKIKNGTLSIPDLISGISEKFTKKQTFDFSKIFQTIMDREKDGEFNALDFIASDFLFSLVRLYSESKVLGADFINSVFEIPFKVQIETFNIVSYFISRILERSDFTLKEFSHVWISLTQDEKEFFLNFIDAHLEKNKDIKTLFLFYASIFNDDKIALEKFFDNALKSENIDLTSSSLGRIAKVLNDDDLLPDFEEFFSENHLLKILDLFSTGKAVPFLVDRGEIPFDGKSLEFDLTTTPIKEMNKLCYEKTKVLTDFYSYLQLLPNECSALGEDFVYLDLVSSLRDFQDDNLDYFGGNLFDENGLFSTKALYQNTALINKIDKKIGFEFLLDQVGSYFTDTEKVNNLAKLLPFINLITGDDKEYGKRLRSSIADSLSQDENFNQTSNFVAYLDKALTDFDSWIDSDEKYQHRLKILNGINKKYQCKQYLNSKIGGSVCPSKQELKVFTNRLLKLISDNHDKDVNSGLLTLIESIRHGGGIEIPYESTDIKNYRLTLKSILNFTFELSRKDYHINNLRIPYIRNAVADKNFFKSSKKIIPSIKNGNKNKSKNEIMTTIERIEVVIRDIRFGNNILGAHYINSVAKTKDQIEVSESKKSLLGTCVKLGLPLCPKKVNKLEKQMIENSFNTFDGLIDPINKQSWSFGPLIQSLLTILTSSSAKGSQVSDRGPVPIFLSDEELENHNGRFLTLISMIGGFSNIGRLIIGHFQGNLNEAAGFINSDIVKIIDANLLKGLNSKDIELNLKKAIDYSLLRGVDKKNYWDYFYDYIETLSDEEGNLLEDILYNGFAIINFVGNNNYHDKEERYADVNIGKVVTLLPHLMGNWRILKKIIPDGIRPEIYLEPIANLFHFYKNKLLLNKSNNTYYKLLNEFILILNKSILKNSDDWVKSIVTTENFENIILDGVISGNVIINDLMDDSGNQLMTLSKVLKLVYEENGLSFNSYQSYLKYISKKENCETGVCIGNHHYDGIYKISKKLSLNKGEDFKSLIQYLFVSKRKNIVDLINRLFPDFEF